MFSHLEKSIQSVVLCQGLSFDQVKYLCQCSRFLQWHVIIGVKCSEVHDLHGRLWACKYLPQSTWMSRTSAWMLFTLAIWMEKLTRSIDSLLKNKPLLFPGLLFILRRWILCLYSHYCVHVLCHLCVHSLFLFGIIIFSSKGLREKNLWNADDYVWYPFFVYVYHSLQSKKNCNQLTPWNVKYAALWFILLVDTG